MVVDWKIFLMTFWVGLVDGWLCKRLYINYTKYIFMQNISLNNLITFRISGIEPKKTLGSKTKRPVG